jgi:hypothetical protein
MLFQQFWDHLTSESDWGGCSKSCIVVGIPAFVVGFGAAAIGPEIASKRSLKVLGLCEWLQGADWSGAVYVRRCLVGRHRGMARLLGACLWLVWYIM